MERDMKEHIPARVNRLHTDYKAEVIGASLLEFYKTADMLFIERVGVSKRARNKDIACTVSRYYDYGSNHYVIKTNREGIYDYLPQGIFHTPTLGGLDKSTEDIVNEIRHQKKQEQDARLFFTPFEAESSYAEMLALLRENCMDNKGGNDDLLEILCELWDVLKALDKGSAKTFIYLLPLLHVARGNKEWFEKCMSAFLGYHVIIKEIAGRVNVGETDVSLFVSNCKLGINTILCGDHYDGYVDWQIEIGPVPEEDMARFIHGSPFSRLLQHVYRYFLPVHIVASQRIISHASETSFTLRSDTDHTNYLGYTTFL